MIKTNCIVKKVKEFVENYNDLFWFDNSIYDHEIQGFRRATDNDFKTNRTNILRFLDCECTAYTKIVKVSNTKFIMYSKNGEVCRDYSSDWQNYLSLTRANLDKALAR